MRIRNTYKITMSKQRAIEVIEQLYPTDSNYPDTNLIGKQYMMEAMDEVGFNWRELPEEILVIWADKCLAKERRDDSFNHDKLKSK